MVYFTEVNSSKFRQCKLAILTFRHENIVVSWFVFFFTIKRTEVKAISFRSEPIISKWGGGFFLFSEMYIISMPAVAESDFLGWI